MNRRIASRKTEWVIHLLFWLLLGYMKFAGSSLQSLFASLNLFFITYAIVFIATFYVHYLVVMKRIFTRFQWKKLVAGIVISYVFFTALRWFTEQVATGLLFNRVNYIDPTFFNYLLDNLSYSSMPIILSSLLWFAIYYIRLLEYNQFILEENKNTEIKFLKAQINPHFVFNTLNNIYSMVYFQSDKSLPAIEKLSQIMQFTTYESQKEKIKLTGEINYIKAYIELEQLRHEEHAAVDLTVEVENENTEIPPYILSPLVENSLKHGVLSDACPIIIELKADREKLSFRVENEIGSQKKDKLGGIGLGNLKQRLDIYYPSCHSLQITTQNNRFIAELQIDLK